MVQTGIHQYALVQSSSGSVRPDSEPFGLDNIVMEKEEFFSHFTKDRYMYRYGMYGIVPVIDQYGPRNRFSDPCLEIY